MFDLGVVNKHAFATFVVERNADVFHDHEAQVHAGSEPEFDVLVAALSTLLAVGGIALAWRFVTNPGPVPMWFGQITNPIQTLFRRKYFFDELYEDLIVSKVFYRYFAKMVDRLDMSGLDNVNVQLYRWTDRAGRAIAKVQDGQVQTYGIVSLVGLILAIVIFVVVAQ